jgi:guanylate kinase
VQLDFIGIVYAMPEGNSLKHIGILKSILKNYKPNIEFIDILKETPLVLLAAPTAAGRNTMIKRLIMTGKYYYVISDTTRRPRINNGIPERSGTEYWFKSEDEFLHGLKSGAYIEAAIIHNQQVSGISLDEMRRARDSGNVAITDIDVHGCDSIVSFSDSTIPIFILPPDFKEWMHRLDGRGSMAPPEKKRRLQSAAKEIRLALSRPYFKFIVNWDLRMTVEELHEHITSGRFDEKEQKIDKYHADKLLTDLDNFLAF